jgi:cytochrome c
VAAALLLAGAQAWSGDVDEPQVPQPVEACLSCHAIGPNEPVLKGPTLWQVVGRPIASVEGFTYSAALHRKQGVWDRATLDRWLMSPQTFAPGTLMTLGGVRNAADRQVVIDFLATLAPGREVREGDE